MSHTRRSKRQKTEKQDKPSVTEFRDAVLSQDKEAIIRITSNQNQEQQEAGFDCLVRLAAQHQDDAIWFVSDVMSNDMNEPADMAGRVFGAAGRVDMIDEVLKRKGVKGAIYAFAFNGMADKVEEILLRKDLPYKGMMPPFLEAEFGFDAGGHMKDPDKLLRILSLINDAEIRKEFSTSLMVDTDEAVRKYRSEHVPEGQILMHEGPVTDYSELVQKASEINHYIRTCHMTYEQALEMHGAMKEIDRQHPNGIVGRLFGDSNARTNAIMAKVAEIKDRNVIEQHRFDR